MSSHSGLILDRTAGQSPSCFMSPFVHLLRRKQPSNMCGNLKSAFQKVAFQVECTDIGHFDLIKNMTGSTFCYVFMIFDTSMENPSS